jgi:CheY-like chemotaxis protein
MDLYATLKNMHLLVIDDDQWIRDSLKLFFESEGCRTVALETAEEGLVQAANQRFDIMFVDYRLPGMNGVEFVKHLSGNAMDAFKVLITAYGNEGHEQEALQSGFDAFIAKPFTTLMVENSLKHLLESKREDRGE